MKSLGITSHVSSTPDPEARREKKAERKYALATATQPMQNERMGMIETVGNLHEKARTKCGEIEYAHHACSRVAGSGHAELHV